jgi:hypothetical protein
MALLGGKLGPIIFTGELDCQGKITICGGIKKSLPQDIGQGWGLP